jgi:hypothetical protein
MILHKGSYAGGGGHSPEISNLRWRAAPPHRPTQVPLQVRHPASFPALCKRATCVLLETLNKHWLTLGRSGFGGRWAVGKWQVWEAVRRGVGTECRCWGGGWEALASTPQEHLGDKNAKNTLDREVSLTDTCLQGAVRGWLTLFHLSPASG